LADFFADFFAGFFLAATDAHLQSRVGGSGDENRSPRVEPVIRRFISETNSAGGSDGAFNLAVRVVQEPLLALRQSALTALFLIARRDKASKDFRFHQRVDVSEGPKRWNSGMQKEKMNRLASGRVAELIGSFGNVGFIPRLVELARSRAELVEHFSVGLHQSDQILRL